jgi:hypothetical protein
MTTEQANTFSCVICGTGISEEAGGFEDNVCEDCMNIDTVTLKIGQTTLTLNGFYTLVIQGKWTEAQSELEKLRGIVEDLRCITKEHIYCAEMEKKCKRL